MKKLYFLLIASLLFFSAAFSQKGVYIKFATITNAVTGLHANEFPALAFEITDSSTSTAAPGGGGGSGRSYLGVAKIKKLLDPETNPALMAVCTTGKHLSTTVITWYNSSNVAYYQITLSDIIFKKTVILAPQCTGTDCDNLYEEIHIDYAKIEWKNPITGTVKTASK